MADTDAQLCFRFVVDQLKQIHRRLEKKRQDDYGQKYNSASKSKILTKKAEIKSMIKLYPDL